MPATCEIVSAIHATATRTIIPFDPAVVPVARIPAGVTNDGIREFAEFEGIIRSFSDYTRDAASGRSCIACPRPSYQNFSKTHPNEIVKNFLVMHIHPANPIISAAL